MAIGQKRRQAVRRLSSRQRRGHGWRGTLVLLLLGFSALFLPRPIDAAERQTEGGPASTSLLMQRSDAPEGPMLLPARRDEAGPASTPPGQSPGPATLYELAAARYGVSSRLLRALHEIESGAAAGGCLSNREGSGALGPFQFMPATFAVFGVDADGDGRADICSFADSLFSAARYLRELGADADPSSAASQRALRLYGTDVGRVVARVS